MNHPYTKHKQLYLLLQSCKLMEQRHSIVFSFSNERTENSSELSNAEIDNLINYLKSLSNENGLINDFTRGDKMRKRLLSLCHEYGWTNYDPGKNKNVVDYEKLNGWMLKYGYLHKPLNEYKYTELPELVTQFETIVKKYLQTI